MRHLAGSIALSSISPRRRCYQPYAFAEPVMQIDGRSDAVQVNVCFQIALVPVNLSIKFMNCR